MAGAEVMIKNGDINDVPMRNELQRVRDVATDLHNGYDYLSDECEHIEHRLGEVGSAGGKKKDPLRAQIAKNTFEIQRGLLAHKTQWSSLNSR